MSKKREKILRILVVLLALIILHSLVTIRSSFAQGTIYIRPDGSIDPPSAPIQRSGDLYTITADVSDSIVVQRNNMTIDGKGHKLQGAGSGYGFDISYRRNVTIKNTYISGFATGVYLYSYYAGNRIVDNVITNNSVGIVTDWENVGFARVSIIGNNITSNRGYGISLRQGVALDVEGNVISNNGGSGIYAYFAGGNFFGNTIADNNGSALEFQAFLGNLIGNTIVGNRGGISGYDFRNSNVKGNIMFRTGNGLSIDSPQNNIIESNNMTENDYGISFWASLGSGDNLIANNSFVRNNIGFTLDFTTNNVIYHNNFVDNAQQVLDPNVPFEVQVWDSGYPSGGNYWSNYTGSDFFSGPNQDLPGSDGIGDIAHIINAWDVWINKDNYPLMNPSGLLPYVLTVTHTEGGATDPASGTYTYSVGSVAAVAAVPETGSVFDHWEIDNVDAGSANPMLLTMDTNHALHAVFKAKPVLAITSSTGGTTDPPPGNYVYDFGSVATVSALPDAGYLFDHWMLDGVNFGSANPLSLTMDGNHFLQAVFRLVPDIAVIAVTPHPANVRQGEPVYVDVVVENQYGSAETFDVVVYADRDRRVIGDEIIVGMQTVYDLVPGTRVTLNFTWDTSVVQSGSSFYISAKAIVAVDRDLGDNLLTAKKKVVLRS